MLTKGIDRKFTNTFTLRNLTYKLQLQIKNLLDPVHCFFQGINMEAKKVKLEKKKKQKIGKVK
jgi:hypothetical protein